MSISYFHKYIHESSSRHLWVISTIHIHPVSISNILHKMIIDKTFIVYVQIGLLSYEF